MIVLLLSSLAVAGDGPGCINRKVTPEAQLDLDLVVAARGGRPTAIRLMAGSGPEDVVGPVQSRLRDRIKEFVGCYREAYPVGGPGLLLRMSFELVEGEPGQVAVDGPKDATVVTQCVQQVLAETPFQCKLSAADLIYPIQLSEPEAAGPTEAAAATP